MCGYPSNFADGGCCSSDFDREFNHRARLSQYRTSTNQAEAIRPPIIDHRKINRSFCLAPLCTLRPFPAVNINGVLPDVRVSKGFCSKVLQGDYRAARQIGRTPNQSILTLDIEVRINSGLWVEFRDILERSSPFVSGLS